MNQLLIPTIIILVVPLLLFCGLIRLLLRYGLDRLRHPEEWKDAGSSGERLLYLALVKELKVPEGQILRNVYVPTEGGQTSEIDLLAISKKGIFVFECKNYGGNIYGDARRPRWIQYIGSQKNYFYNPLLQNKNHAKNLKRYLGRYGIEVPIIPLFSPTSRGSWKLRNLKSDDYILGRNCRFKDVYNSLPDSKIMAKNYQVILNRLTPLSRPAEAIRRNHVAQIKR